MYSSALNKHGKRGSGCEVFVPPGTVVRDLETGEELGDLSRHDVRLVVAEGGLGGRGNVRFKSSTNRAPRRADPGRPGERRELELELKLIADVGLVGRPNAGKTTLLGCLTGSTGKVAAYPFTTLEPNLGILKLPGYRRSVLADVPGLIEGAHRGEGLGLNFLRHIERTGALAVLVDTMPPEGDTVQHYETLCSELHHYSEALLERPRMVVATKTDLSPPAAVIEALRAAAEADDVRAVLHLAAQAGVRYSLLHVALSPRVTASSCVLRGSLSLASEPETGLAPASLTCARVSPRHPRHKSPP